MLYEWQIGWVLFPDKSKPEEGKFCLRYNDLTPNFTDMAKDTYDASYWFNYGVSFGENYTHYKIYQENDQTIIDLTGE